MDPKLMRQWLAGQAKKTQISEADMQRKRLGIGEDKKAPLTPGLIREGIVPRAEAANKAGASAVHSALMNPEFRSSSSSSLPMNDCQRCRKTKPLTADSDCAEACGKNKATIDAAMAKKINENNFYGLVRSLGKKKI